MKKRTIPFAFILCSLCAGAHTVQMPVTASDLNTITAEMDTLQEEMANVKTKLSLLDRIHLGGYGEATFNYNFRPERKAIDGDDTDLTDLDDAQKRASLNIPRIVVMLGINLGKGWGVETDVAFENCNRVALDQFWIEKLFTEAAGLRVGYLTLPVGAMNAHDDPLEFFAVNRPEGEDAIVPCDWHQTGLSFFGTHGPWSYEAILIAGINSSIFTGDAWLRNGAHEFKQGHDMAFVGRIDNTSVPGLRMSISGYYGASLNNRFYLPSGEAERVRGNIGFLSFDFLYDNYGVVVRGSGSMGQYGRHVSANGGYGQHHTAYTASFEGGYNIFENWMSAPSCQKLYVFGRYDYCEPSEENAESWLGYDWSRCQRVGAGINYFPIDRVAVKAEYSHTFYPGGFSRPMVSLGVAYSGQFF